VFFGFDFVLTPLALKWSCGGEMQADLLKISELVAAFPEQAEDARIQEIVSDFVKVAQSDSPFDRLLAKEPSPQKQAELCEVARPLEAPWSSPEALRDDEDAGLSESQKDAWQAFWRYIEKEQG
jgi:hypothetical protein